MEAAKGRQFESSQVSAQVIQSSDPVERSNFMTVSASSRTSLFCLAYF